MAYTTIIPRNAGTEVTVELFWYTSSTDTTPVANASLPAFGDVTTAEYRINGGSWVGITLNGSSGAGYWRTDGSEDGIILLDLPSLATVTPVGSAGEVDVRITWSSASYVTYRGNTTSTFATRNQENVEAGSIFPSNFTSMGINGSGHVSQVTLVDTTTTNTDMRGTESANTVAPLDAAGTRTAVGLASANLDTQFSAVPTDVWTAGTRGLTEDVTTDAASRTASQADVSTLAVEDGGRLEDTQTKTTAIQTVLSGITNLGNWLRAAWRSDAPDGTAATEIGGTYDSTSHSQQAIRDRGDAAWTGGGGGGDGWTVAEREQLRDALGVDGTKTTATGGQLQDVLTTTTYTGSLPTNFGAFDISAAGLINLQASANNDAVISNAVDTSIDSAGLSTHDADDVWTVVTRGLTEEVTTDAASRTASQADVSLLALEASVQTALSDLTAIQGSGFVTGTDSLQAIRDRGDTAWITATGFSTHDADAVWTSGTRSLTDKDGFALAADGLDLITLSEPASGDPATWSLPEHLKMVSQRNFGRMRHDSNTGQVTLYGDDGTTVVSTQTWSTTAGVEEQGESA